MNKDPKNIAISDYTYYLPEDRIAFHPLEQRDSSRLLIYKDGRISEDSYFKITDHLPENSLLIFNNTKVVEARILFQKPTGGLIEIFCLEPHEQYPDISTAFAQHEKVLWHCLVGGVSKWKHGQVLEKIIESDEKAISLRARYIEKRSDSFIIELSWTPAELSFAHVLHHAGAIPLPPYIKRAAEKKDAETYQTIYAEPEGSVAAPTAGLHFTPGIINSLNQKNIHTDFLTLHVGAGTFKPVKSETMQDHEMHAEWIDVKKETIQKITDHLNNNIIAVGTTSLRTIESLYWLGVKLLAEESVIPMKQHYLGQWEPYQLESKKIPVEKALSALIKSMEKNKEDRLIAKTQILIAPGYSFKIVTGLVTNFHQPKSTLLLLVAAFVGDDWKKIYEYALENKFRFLSYGDGSLLFKTITT